MREHSGGWPARRAFRARQTLVLLVVLTAAYLASIYGPVYWGYLRISMAVRAAASAAAAEPWDVKTRLDDAKEAWSSQVSAAAINVGVSFADDAITIEQVGDEAVVRAVWGVPVAYPLIGVRHTLEFRAESRQPFVNQ